MVLFKDGNTVFSPVGTTKREEEMAYDIECRSCRQHTWAGNIVELLNTCTDPKGKFICQHCRSTDTFIYRESKLQEEGEVWERWIKGVIRIDSGYETYCPYIFLTADNEDDEPNGLHFHYYKDTRSQPNGRLKHGHGPGGPPVLRHTDLFLILQHLISLGILSKEEIESFMGKL